MNKPSFIVNLLSIASDICRSRILLSAIAIGVSYLLLHSNSVAEANELTFFCNSQNYRSERIPVTSINPETGGRSIALIHWVSEYFSMSGATPEVRCEIATARLQAYYDEGSLGSISTHEFDDGSQVICVLRRGSSECTESDIIVTLPPDVDRFDALNVMTDMVNVLNATPLELTDDLLTYRNGEAFVSLEILTERLQ